MLAIKLVLTSIEIRTVLFLRVGRRNTHWVTEDIGIWLVLLLPLLLRIGLCGVRQLGENGLLVL